MTRMRPLIFASCYVYSPQGQGRLCEHSRLLRSLVKEADARFIEKYVLRVQQEVCAGSMALRGFFSSDDVLVPVPGSTPHAPDRAWAADTLAKALVGQGLGRVAWPGLRRISKVRKSAYASSGARPSVWRHYESFALADSPLRLNNIVLIDDIVTKGRTLMAAAARVRERFPEARIRAFALVRTMGRGGELHALLHPCRGEIRWLGNDAYRRP
jgi:predicted amidophosphoribosyltransferase